MAVLKVACSKCGQRVSGDDSFYGTTVECPVCSSTIRFPENPLTEKTGTRPIKNSEPEPGRESRPAPEPEKSYERGSTYERGSERPADRASSAPPKLETSSIQLNPRPAASLNDEDLPSPLLGVVSMVLGIVSVMLLCLPGILFGPAAIIAGHIAVAKARHSRIRPFPGKSAAITGLILGYISLIGFILITLLIGPWIVEKIRASAPPQ